MKTKYKFSEGQSLNYLAHSVGVLIVSLILSGLFTFYFLAFGVVIVIVLLSATTGIELDLTKKTFCSYKSVFGKVFREEIDLTPYKSGRLIFTNESNTYEARTHVNTVRVRTFDLELHTPNWDAKHIYEFQDYKVAKTIVDLLQEHMEIEVFDEWGVQAAKAFQNRRMRR